MVLLLPEQLAVIESSHSKNVFLIKSAGNVDTEAPTHVNISNPNNSTP